MRIYSYHRHLVNEPSLTTMIILSVAIHILIVAMGVVIPKLASKRIFFSPVYTVSLVAPSIQSRSETASVKTEPAEKQKEAMDKKRTADIEAVKTKEDYDRIVSNSIRRIAAIKKIEALKRMRGKVTDSQRVFTATKDDRLSTEQTQDRISGIGGRRDILGLKYQDYYSMIWERIRRLWVLPEGVVKDKDLMLVMTIRVKRDGSIEKYWIEEISGNLYFDQSAIRAINKASPLPPLPKDLNQDTLDIGIRFFP